LHDSQPQTLKSGDTFGVFDRFGDIAAETDGAEGLFFRDTRHLSRLTLSICARRPVLLSSALRDDNGTLSCDLTNPDLLDEKADGREVLLEHDLIHIRRTKFILNDICFERLALRNFSGRPELIRLDIAFAADFADVFEVRGMTRDKRGIHYPAKVGSDTISLAYNGLDQQRRETRIRFWPAPAALDANCASFELTLEPRGRAVVFVEVNCAPSAEPLDPPQLFRRSLLASRRNFRNASRRAPRITTSNDIFNESVHRAAADLYTLNTDLADGPYPYAGIPWFSTVFGRDGIITALQTLWFDPAIARGVLGHLAAHQAESVDAKTDAEPGKILHEMRRCEMANTGEVPFGQYYGSIDSTPLFIMLAGAYLKRTGDSGFIKRLWPHIIAALGWIDNSGDRDGDGFVEYFRATENGLVNQGWKDSFDSVFHADGTLARGPIALVEVQAYVYGAKLAAADMARIVGDDGLAARLNDEAKKLRAAFDAAFWDEDLGTYVLALDGDKRPCRVRASNAGHALFTGIALPERAVHVVNTLMSRDSFSGWGIRTIAAGEARYNPISYHNGSVWPHDNALIAHGFAQYGFRHEAAQVLTGLFGASTFIDLRRLPELFCGFLRTPGQGPTFYPLACSPQAWSATAILSLLQNCLGLGFNIERRQVEFRHPILPAFLHEVTLRGLSLADARIDVALRRSKTDVSISVLSRQGEIDAIETH
jgi:glycogen debranching enzyme